MKRAIASAANGAQAAPAGAWLLRLQHPQPDTSAFVLCPEAGAEGVASAPGLQRLQRAALALPPDDGLAFESGFSDPAQALGPWLVLHLFDAGFDQVLCVHPGLPDTPSAPAPGDLFSLLDPHTDLVLGPGPGARAWPFWLAQNTPRSRALLGAWQTHLQDLRATALAAGGLADACLWPAVSAPASQAVVWGPDWPGLDPVPTEQPGDLRRLHAVFRALLRRAPDSAALRQLLPLMHSRGGLLRAALALARSAESRALPDLARRLARALAPLSGGSAWSQPPPLATGPRSETPTRKHHTPAAPVAAPDRLPCPLGLNLVGYIKAELGVGEAARSLARACHAAQIAYSTFDVGHQSPNLQRDHSVLDQASQRHFAIDLLYVNPSHTEATVQQLRASGQPRGAYTIGFWHWEQPVLPPHFHAAFAHVDEVWVPSTFVHDAVADVSPVPVWKVPHALSISLTPGLSRREFALPEDHKLVLVMYDFMSSQYRKNPQAAIAAYRIAARHHPELGLVIKTLNGDHHPQALAALRESVADLPHVTFITHFLTRQASWDLMACCDVLLSLHRAEGFGLAPAEMMFLGKPVVATGWSANMDFMTADNSFPVRYELKPLAQALEAYPAGPLWAEADVEHAAHGLMALAGDPALAQRLGQRAARDIREQLSPQAVGARIRQRLQMLGHWHPELLTLARLRQPAP